MTTLLKYSLLTAFVVTAWNCSSDSDSPGDSPGDDSGGSTSGTTPSGNTSGGKVTVKLTTLQRHNLKGKVKRVDVSVDGVSSHRAPEYNEAGFVISNTSARSSGLYTYNSDNFILSEIQEVKAGVTPITLVKRTYDYYKDNLLKAYTEKLAIGDETTINYVFDDAKKTLTGTNGKTEKDKTEKDKTEFVITYDNKLNKLAYVRKSYFNGQESVNTSKYDANGLIIETDNVDHNHKYEYNDNFQETKRVFVDKKDASKNSTAVFEYNSSGHLLTSTTSILKGEFLVKVDTVYLYDEYELDAQNNWTKRVSTKVKLNPSSSEDKYTKETKTKRVVTRVITYY